MNQDHYASDQLNYNASDSHKASIASNPMKIVLMVYDGGINFLEKAIEYSENGDIKNKNIYTDKVIDIVIELNNSLNIEAGSDTAVILRKLYDFMYRHLSTAKLNNEAKELKEVLRIFVNLKEGWKHVAGSLKNSDGDTTISH